MTAVQTTYVLPSATEGRLPQMCFFLCRTVTLLKISPLQRYAIQESQRDCYVKFSPQPYLHSVVDRTNSKRVQLVKPHARTHAHAHTHIRFPPPPLYLRLCLSSWTRAQWSSWDWFLIMFALDTVSFQYTRNFNAPHFE